MNRSKPTRGIRILSLLLFAFFSLVVSAPSAHADAWGANAAAAILKETLERIRRTIEGVVLSSTKAAATSILNAQVGVLIGGSNLGESGIVTDWEVYLYTEPANKTKIYMDSYLTSMTGGRAASNYAAAGTSGSSYANYLKRYAQGNLASSSGGQSVPVSNAEEQVGDFQNEIAKGNISAINVYFQGVNNPFAITLEARAQEQATYEALQKIQESKAVAYGGYKGTETADGKTVLPGSTVRDMVSTIYGIGPNIIATSSNPAELASGVVLAAVNKTVTGLFRQGIGTIRSNIEREVSSVSTQVNRQINGLTSYGGTQIQFTPSTQQQTGVSPNSAANVQNSIP